MGCCLRLPGTLTSLATRIEPEGSGERWRPPHGPARRRLGQHGRGRFVRLERRADEGQGRGASSDMAIQAGVEHFIRNKEGRSSHRDKHGMTRVAPSAERLRYLSAAAWAAVRERSRRVVAWTKMPGRPRVGPTWLAARWM
jgi:hypothetical protein